MPGDAERSARLGDNLALAIEYANAKLLAGQDADDMTHARSAAAELRDAVQEVLQDLERNYSRARNRGQVLTQQLLTDLNSAFASLGMSEEQEEGVETLVRATIVQLAGAYDFSGVTQTALTDLATRLAAILRPETRRPEHGSEAHEHSSVDLF